MGRVYFRGSGHGELKFISTARSRRRYLYSRHVSHITTKGLCTSVRATQTRPDSRRSSRPPAETATKNRFCLRAPQPPAGACCRLPSGCSSAGTVAPVRPCLDPHVQSLDPAIEVLLVSLPCYAVHAGRGVTLHRVERRSQHGEINMVQERREPLLFPGKKTAAGKHP